MSLVVRRENDEFGRYLELLEGLGEGELIFREEPLISGPVEGAGNYETCLGCYELISKNNEYKCSSCSWPVCSQFCEKLPAHRDFECGLFEERNIGRSVIKEYCTKILALRCLLLKTVDPPKYTSLLNLESHDESREKFKTFSTYRFIRTVCNLQVSFDLVHKIIGIMAVNSFGTSESLLQTPNSPPKFGALLFKTASLISHSCSPNSSWEISYQNDSFAFRVSANVDLLPNTMITIPYLDITKGTMDRRADLRQTFFFECKCKRCSDPTELQTFFSSFICEFCGSHTIPLNSLNSRSRWKCVNCDWVGPYEYKLIQAIVHDMKTKIEGTHSIDSVRDVERMIEKYEGIIVGVNHYLIVDLKIELMKRSFTILENLQQFPSKNITKEELVKVAEKMNIVVKDLLTLAQILYPGTNKIREKLISYEKYSRTFLQIAGQEEIAGKLNEMNLQNVLIGIGNLIHK